MGYTMTTEALPCYACKSQQYTTLYWNVDIPSIHKMDICGDCYKELERVIKQWAVDRKAAATPPPASGSETTKTGESNV